MPVAAQGFLSRPISRRCCKHLTNYSRGIGKPAPRGVLCDMVFLADSHGGGLFREMGHAKLQLHWHHLLPIREVRRLQLGWSAGSASPVFKMATFRETRTEKVLP